MIRTLYKDGTGRTAAECFDLVLSVMPFFREHCHKNRSKWDSFHKFRKGMMDLLGTTDGSKGGRTYNMLPYIPKAIRPEVCPDGSPLPRQGLQRLAGKHLAHRLVNGKVVPGEDEVEAVVTAEMIRLRREGESY